jgi:predicted RND superfamily exporter protein
VFRSIGLAAVTLISNAVPIAMGFGMMGLLGLPVDAGTVVVGCIAFGIGVDDTIHTATEFATKSVTCSDRRQVIIDSYVRVLPAIVTTTVVVSVGFFLLGTSSFALIRNLGLITAGVLVLCLVADVFLLPSLLSLGWLRGFRGEAR